MDLKDFIEDIVQLSGEMYLPMGVSSLFMNICKEYLLRKMKKLVLRSQKN